MATHVTIKFFSLQFMLSTFFVCRAASKDPELERTYLGLLKESSMHEKSIVRDLGR